MGLAGALGICIPGHHDDRDGGIDRADSLEQFKTAHALGIQRRDPSLEHDATWTGDGEEIAIPGWWGGVGGQEAVRVRRERSPD